MLRKLREWLALQREWDNFRTNAPAMGGHLQGDGAPLPVGNVPVDNVQAAGGHFELQPAGGAGGEDPQAPNLLVSLVSRIRRHI